VTIVSNASPLINLARIDELDLLRELYGELLIPEAVWQEVVVKGAGQPGTTEVEAASWIKRMEVTNEALAHALSQELDLGEAESIALALEVGAQVLLMDERLGRETARHLGLRCIGLVGVLIQAKRRGLIGRIRPLLDALRTQAGFRLGSDLYARVLEDEGETD
jgi:predicted nucleic acid-binding protein